MRALLIVLLLVVCSFGKIERSKVAANSRIAISDTIYVDSTETEYSRVFWQEEGES